jgi:hypothetical protein
MSRHRARFWDPTGAKYGLPTWPWRMAPDGLATRRQLAARGRRPGGQPIAGQVMWARRRGVGVAYLYRLDLALPKRPLTPAKRAALGRALAARRQCPTCRRDVGYVIPRRYGECVPCHDKAVNGAAA